VIRTILFLILNFLFFFLLKKAEKSPKFGKFVNQKNGNLALNLLKFAIKIYKGKSRAGI